MTGKTTILYHGGCWDGWGAAMVASDALGGGMQLVPCHYGMDPYNLNVKGHDVYVLDFSLPPKQMTWLAGEAKHLTWIDHHKTAVEAMVPVVDLGIMDSLTDMNRSGIRLTWDWFSRPEDERPWLVDYIEDRDLWRKALPNHEEVLMWIRSHEMTEWQWHEMMSTDWRDASVEGSAMWCYHLRLVANAAANMVWADIGGVTMPLVTCSYDLGSDVCDYLLTEHGLDVAAYFLLNKAGQWQYGFRSTDRFDCSALAKRFGGGGHAQAAGCQADEPIHRLLP
jgi:oligoribonuclease NrnB/cAMP/cGMP phosphodiesterase (DHH superfamily)